MKHQLKQYVMTFVMMGFLSPTWAVPKLIPVINGQFSMGQWYSDGNKSALGGNAVLNIIPAIRYTNRFSLIPSFSSSYRGTRSAEELAGGSTLFQDTWENGINLKAVHGLSQNIKLRENFGVRSKWYRETVDENWNKGLYDYRVFNGGFEGEYAWNKKTSLAFGYDFSFLQFPNYQSLESDQSSDLSREYSSANPLDQSIHLASLRFNAPLVWNVTAGIQSFFSPRFYRNQTVVNLSGLLTSEKRKDSFVGSTISFEKRFSVSSSMRLSPTIFYGYSSLNSNQNHYDARRTQFLADFYDYDQQRLGAQLSLAFGRNPSGPSIVEIGGAYSNRQYRSRVIQSSSGSYLTEKLYIRDSQVSLAYSFPLNRNFRMRASSIFGNTKSNNQYESVYRYNFSNANYQFGVSYDY